jgi:hypothetical protein
MRGNYIIKMHLHSGYYENLEKIVHAMNGMIEKYFRNPVPHWNSEGVERAIHRSVWPRFRYSTVNRKFQAILHPNMRIAFADKLMDTLGIGKRQNPMYNTSHEEIMMFRGNKTCDLDGGVHAIYVYCNLLEGVPVGDTMAPLLGIVDVEGKLGDVIKRSFLKPRYIPLQKKAFDSLEILIKDAYGEKVPFENGTSTVTLHFRQTKDTYFLG